jgi:hypothetical protein
LSGLASNGRRRGNGYRERQRNKKMAAIAAMNAIQTA